MKAQTNIDDLAALAKLATYPEWKVAVRMSSNTIEYYKDHIVALDEKKPGMAIDKAFDRGIITGVVRFVKDINSAAAEMEKLAIKEDNGQ